MARYNQLPEKHGPGPLTLSFKGSPMFSDTHLIKHLFIP